MEYEALVDFEAVESNELTIRTIFRNEHWWYGKLDNNEGLFPSSFVRKYTPPRVPQHNVAEPSTHPMPSNPLQNSHSTIDSCLDKLKNVSTSTFLNGSDTTDQLRLEAKCESFRGLIVDRIQHLSKENQQLSAAITKYNECISMYQKSTMENYQGGSSQYTRPM